ncbi:kinase-like domain-containing protein [Triangularia verruculosa]|uniref:Kinase-like domain-containing protein n=1 Tax=Triangularia verruculosa TaxID=2587418 RepID=A0AAN7ATY5_9PEZI|nr:kinase-like domain-containing protein [Triangularia verruculosa]
MTASPNRRHSTMWWDDDTIERTVTRMFVCSHLIPEEIERLDRTLGFGDGLTDGTYWEWIEQKAKKIFLILVELGVPDQIFGVIDDSWDDEDLPVARDQVERLALTPTRNSKVEREFYERQFYYLLRPLIQGHHVTYEDNEVVPLEVVDKKHVAGQSPSFDKVMLPGQTGTVFSRVKMPIGGGYSSHEDFVFEVNGIRNVRNDHLASYWGSYVQQGYAYALFTNAADYTLKSFLTTTPACFKSMDKKMRRRQVMEWIHCLIDTVCFLHNRGLSHGNIKPSTVLFTGDNQIFLSDLLGYTGLDRNSFDKESYDYAAPEQWFKPSSPSSTSFHRRGTIPSMTASPESPNYITSRSTPDSSQHLMSMMHAPTPHLSPQAADIFSLGCIILDLLSFLVKKHGRPFATYRAAKHKAPSRGGAVPDSSFHRNLSQVESWMTQLVKDAQKKEKDDPVFKGMAPMLHVVEHMLSSHPTDRPDVQEVQTRMYKILTEQCGILEPHCVHRYDNGWDFDMASLKLDTTDAARRGSGGPGRHHPRNSIGSRGSGRSSGSAQDLQSQQQTFQVPRISRSRSSRGPPSIASSRGADHATAKEVWKSQVALWNAESRAMCS